LLFYLNSVDYFVTDDYEATDAIKKVTKSFKQHEKTKTKVDNIYGYDERNERMGSRKRNRWING